MAGYYRGRPRRSGPPLTPPGELVGFMVKWRPKRADGSRSGTAFGTVRAYNEDARTLTMEVSRDDVSAWQTQRTRTVDIPLSHGPFTLASVGGA